MVGGFEDRYSLSFVPVLSYVSFGWGARNTTLGGIRNSRVLFATCITYRFLRKGFFSGSDCKTILECYFAQHLELCVPLLRYYWL